jgi:hypothetical protein
MMRGLPPSMTAASELVVPRSMPMMRAMGISPGDAGLDGP